MSLSQIQVQQRVLKALKKLKDTHADLLCSNMPEGGLIKCFLKFVEDQFKGWQVELNNTEESVWPSNRVSAKRVSPDIVVRHHQSGERLLAMEIKKFGCPAKAIKRDRENLYDYLTQLNYQHGLFVFLPTAKAKTVPLENLLRFHPPVPAEKKTKPETFTPLKTTVTVKSVATQNNDLAPKTEDPDTPKPIENEHLLKPIEASPLIYPDQTPTCSAPKLPYPVFSINPSRPTLKPLGIDIDKAVVRKIAAPEYENIKEYRIPKELLEYQHEDIVAETPLEEETHAVSKETPRQAESVSFFPSRFYVDPAMLKQRKKENFENLPQPQKPTMAPFEGTAHYYVKGQDSKPVKQNSSEN